jgi:hypothetical protein
VSIGAPGSAELGELCRLPAEILAVGHSESIGGSHWFALYQKTCGSRKPLAVSLPVKKAQKATKKAKEHRIVSDAPEVPSPRYFASNNFY